ncbi:MAG: hypothetical protein ACI9SP_002632 [Arenicella sp.]|jgi:hypothetical protein
MLSIYPDDIAAGHDVIVTYLYTTGDNATAGQAEVDISNTVCLNYYDTANGVTTTAYADPASGDCATETITTTPVTLAEFNAYRYAGGFQFNWVDAIKTNNLGFNIYTALGQSLFKINADLIPSQMVSILEASEYTSWFDLGQFALADEFYLEDIDIEGKVARHGPFKLSKKPAFNAKSKYVAAPRINWGEVKSKNARARAKNDTSNKGQSKKSNELDDSISVVNISLQEAGLQRISLSELSVVGFRATDMAKGRYLLTNSVGDLVPSRIVSANNGDYLEFVAAIVRRFYSDKAFYQLRHAQKPRSVNEIPTVSSGLSGVASEYYLHTQTLDDDNRYIFTSKIAGDPWMMNRMFARGRTVTSSLVVPVPDAYQGSAAPDAVVTAEFVDGVNFPSEVDHKVDLYANSQLLGSLDLMVPRRQKFNNQCQ